MSPDAPDPEVPDLRSRTRDALRAEIAETAWNVFAERGFDDVTVDEAARLTGISRATFFRYFASKEEAVFVALETMGAEFAEALAARPAGEDAWTALRCAFDMVTPRYEANPGQSLARLNLTRKTPSLRAHELERHEQWQRLLGTALAPRLGLEPGDVRVEALVGAAISALDAATEGWANSNGALDLVALIDQAFAAIGDPPPPLR